VRAVSVVQVLVIETSQLTQMLSANDSAPEQSHELS